MDERRKVFNGVKSQTLVVVLLGIIDLAYFSAMSRLLTKAEFGLYAIAIAVTSILQEITSAGLGSAIIQKKNPSERFISTAFSLSLIICSFSVVLLVLLSGQLSEWLTGSDTLTYPLIILAFTMFFSIINGIGRALYMRELKFLHFGAIQLSAVGLANLCGVCLAYTYRGYGVYAISIALLLNSLFMFVYLFFVRLVHIPLTISRIHIKEIISYGGWLTASGIVRSIYEQVDKLVTVRFLTVAQLGAYNRPAGFLASVSGQVNGIFDTILFPVLSDIQDDERKIGRAYQKSTETVIVAAVFFSILVILGSNIIIRIFLGEQWLSLQPVFHVIAVSVIFLFYGRIGDSFFRSLGIVKSYFFVRVIVCCSSVVLIVAGCQYGILGLAFAVLLSRMVDNLVKILFLRRKIAINHADNFICIFKKCLVPLVLCGLALPVKFYYNNVLGDILSIVLFVSFALTVVFFRPHVYGEVINNLVNQTKSKIWIRNQR